MNETKLDEIDLRLLAELQHDSSRPIHELAEIVGMSMASCNRHVKRMEQSGIIQRYVAILNPEALGLTLEVFVSVRLNTQKLKTMQEFRRRVLRMAEVVQCYALTGDSDFLLHVRTAGISEYNTWMQENLIGVASILNTRSSISLECIKYSTALPLPLSPAPGEPPRVVKRSRKKPRK